MVFQYKQWEQLDIVKVGHEKDQAGSTRQPIAGYFHSADFQFLFPIFSATFFHRALHLMGLTFFIVLLFLSLH